MKTRVQAKRKKATDKAPQKPWAKLQPRPFAAESEANSDAAPLNQAQIDRVAHAPNLAAMPLYATDAIASSGNGAALQAKATAEPNLKSPQGTVQRQAEDQKAREELLQTSADPAKEELQMQAEPEEKQLQTQLAEKEEKAVQEKAEVGAEAEKDEEVQAKLETEEEETLQRQDEAEDAEEEVMETEEDLAIAQHKKK